MAYLTQIARKLIRLNSEQIKEMDRKFKYLKTGDE